MKIEKCYRIIGVCLIFLICFTFLGCIGRLSQIKKWQEAGEIDPVIEALNAKVWLTRANAANALGEMKNARAVDPLILTLKDRLSDVRLEAALALGRIKDIRAVPSLINTLEKDKSRIVRSCAAWALGEIRDASGSFDTNIAFFIFWMSLFYSAFVSSDY